MKNRIKKRRDSALQCNVAQDSKSTSFLYNIQSVSIIIEVLIGAILGVSLCFGFFFAFFVLRGNLVVSFGVFFIILIIALFAILILKYMLILVALKLQEMKLLESSIKHIKK